jgi:two-component system chemotaxis sensor kinase CheA
MSLSTRVREQLLSSFRAELTEHVQTMTDGLLALEQRSVADDQRQSTLEDIFRAAHSLKGAARAMGVTAVEQLAHALEGVLDGVRRDALEPTPEVFNACYQALDAIQAVHAAYEAGEITPPPQALQALANLEPFRPSTGSEPGPQVTAETRQAEAPPPAAPPPSAPAPAQELAPRGSRGDETIRVSVGKLDSLMAQLSELLVTKIRAKQRLTQVRQLQEFSASWQKDWHSVRGAYGRLLRRDVPSVLGLRVLGPVEGSSSTGPSLPDPTLIQGAQSGNGRGKLGKDVACLLDYVATSQERLREMSMLINELAREYANDTMHMSLVVDELEEEVKRARMLPLNTITGPFARMVRDLAGEAGTEAVLRIVGGDTELDKQVLELIKDPLIHLLRNAVDHGIEPPQQREAQGKPRKGVITLTAEQLGKDVVICVSDDGAGLDLEAIREALSRLTAGPSQVLSEAELVESIFNVGVSTKPIITDISGRGVGLDVVRRNVEALHGRIDVDWTPGAGATFTLTLPLALTSSRGLLVRVSGQVFAIPLNVVEHITSVSPQEIELLEGHDTLRYHGQPLTLVRLNDVLGLPPIDLPREDERTLAVILAAAERRMAFAVDELVGEQEVVIKGLGKQLTRVGGIAGATVMGSGEVVLILNAADLIKLAMRGERPSVLDSLARVALTKATRAQRRILIVDDSITTRTLEKNILEAAGYTVQLATDGEEALSAIASSGVPDLIVADIIMPRLDGFDLTRQIKEDPGTAHVPVILVTSLDSPEDKVRGIEAGADAYITKSSFDQGNLLETIEQLI